MPVCVHALLTSCRSMVVLVVVAFSLLIAYRHPFSHPRIGEEDSIIILCVFCAYIRMLPCHLFFLLSLSLLPHLPPLSCQLLSIPAFSFLIID